MKWIKINTVKQQSDNGRFVIRKLFCICFCIIDNENPEKNYGTFETLKDAKKYAEQI